MSEQWQSARKWLRQNKVLSVKKVEPTFGAREQQAASLSRSPGPEPKLVRSDELFEGENEVIILHREGRYRLRITRQDKLILNK